ncbi:MAG: N-acetyltransferase family protein [Nocardioidaceae bacterium]
MTVRDADPQDTDALLRVWSPANAQAVDEHDEAARPEAMASVARICADPDQRLLVALADGEIVGAVHLVRATLSPVHCESAVHVTHLHVLESHRRHGIGRALMEAVVSWAEEKGTVHVLVAASAGSRDANRFMAQLGLGQIAVLRGATVAALRAKLPVEPPAAARVGQRSHRSVGQVLAQRRSLRRAQARTS